jgi:hypothetical protein
MNSKIGSLAILISLTLMSGCVAYAPYPEYSAGPYYGGYGVAPVLPVPGFYHGGWGHDGYGGHGGFGHHRH